MAKRTERGGGDLQYFVRFSITALILVSGTLVLVLVVLPQRYVLSSGFREAGLNFPDPAVPFTPLDPVRIAARPTPEAARPEAIVRGPAEIFWDGVLPFLESGRYEEALPIFEDYLLEHPSDDDVRREQLATLISSGRASEAISGLTELLGRTEDSSLRILLARTLRDLERVEEASDHYAILAGAAPGDLDLALEWARALAWLERYVEAEAVLLGALESSPESVTLRAELARTYYYMNRLIDAQVLLASMTEGELETVEALRLRADVNAALAVPEDEVIARPPPTLLERAVAAREDDDFDAARRLFEMALAEDSDDAGAWLEYANFLEYELSDFVGARAALREVDRLGGADTPLQLRLALLEAWTGDSVEARTRLDALLAEQESGTAPPEGPENGSQRVTTAEVHALMGDLHRWNGKRLEAWQQYGAALADDPNNQRALDGREAIRIEVALLIDDVERPRVGSRAFAIGDSDDFGRLDLGGEWIGVRDDWVWIGTAGRRWLSGQSVPGSPSNLRGTYLEATGARWWRLGTIRTAVRFGTQWVREDAADLTMGASLQYRPVRGGTLTLDYAHEPAYGLTATLQSASAEVSQDRVLASLNHALNDLWSLTVQADAARLDPAGLTGADASTRLQGAVSVARAVNRGWSLGWSAAALTYTEPAPRLDGLRLFWDPATALSSGPVVNARGYLSDRWEASVRIGPGLALIDERAPNGFETVPQLSADARFEYVGPRLRSTIDVFYAQARLEGYRTYGVRFSLSTASRFRREPGR